MNPSPKAAIGGMIAAMYIILTYLAEAVGLASGAVQVRFSEALTLLPCLTPAAIPGLAAGCLLALQIFIGEMISCCFLGLIVLHIARKNSIFPGR